MAEDDVVRQLLGRMADELGTIVAPPVAGLARRRRRREVVGRAVAVAAAVIAVAGVAIAVSVRSTGSSTKVSSTGNPTVGPVTSPSPSVAASAFGAFRWRALPVAPIPVRSGSASAWTGTELFVWGGAIGNQARSDGALYDPATRRWSVLPRSPLPGGQYTQAVVVDGSVLVWTATRAAVFDLRTRSWSVLPPAPPGPAKQVIAQFVTLGNVAVLVRATVDGTSRAVQADTYDLRAHRWFPGAQVLTPPHHGVGEVVALGVRSVVDVWPGWYHSVSAGPGSTETTSGVDAYQFDPQTRSWKSIAVHPGAAADASGALWTGSRILFPQSQVYCGPCSHPVSVQMIPRLVDPTSGTVSTIPNGPLGAAAEDLFWTGESLLAYDRGSQLGPVRPGDLAVWSAATGWRRLPGAGTPLSAEQDVAVWTGKALLVWGIGSDGVRSGTGGVEFVAP